MARGSRGALLRQQPQHSRTLLLTAYSQLLIPVVVLVPASYGLGVGVKGCFSALMLLR